MAQKLQQQLKEVGLKLENPPVSKDSLIKLLKQAATCLSELDQSPSPVMIETMQPCLNAIAKQELLKHQDRDVKVLVATCICEITRITAPEAPYSDDTLRDIFHLIVGIFKGLDDVNAPSFGRRVVILETLARYRSCVVMLDLECDDLVNELFSTFLSVVSDVHLENVVASMQTIMVLLLDESEDVQESLLLTILSALQRDKADVSTAARRLAMNVIQQCAGKLEPCIKQYLLSAISGDNSSLNSETDYHDVIHGLYQCAPQTLGGIIPYLTGELLADKLDVRLKAVKLLGGLFSLSGHAISEMFRPLFIEFLKRLTDRAVEIRISVIEHAKNCLLSDPSRPEAPDIIRALSDRLLDYDENVRKQVVSAIYDVACCKLKSIPVDISRLVSERLRDKSLLVKEYTMEKLAEVYKLYSSRYSDGSISADDFDWMPGKILRCLFDKDFRSENIEAAVCGSLSPAECLIKNKVKQWIIIFSTFEKADVKALEKLLMQKKRLQLEMQKYLTLRQTYQDGDAPELQKRVISCFRIMSRWFSDPAKAEDSFQMLHQLKDANIWKILTTLLDPNTGFHQAYAARDELLKILGDKHPLSDFLDILSIKCSYLLFNKEFVKEILFEIAVQKSAGNAKLIVSSMNLLVILASYSPLFLLGSEEDLVQLLKEEDDIIKEGIVHVLANAGGIIREQLSRTTSSVDLLLERLCLEGNRKQAKYSVQALAAITKDDGLKSLSLLYKRLVDMIPEQSHLPAILQSLGCIAQTAMPIFETREDEIVQFITTKVLEPSSAAINDEKSDWDECSEVCLLKIYGIKTLVKSYLPVKDSHMRQGIEKFVGILKTILSIGEISVHVKSSTSDKAHLRLASAKAILRLSKYWDHKIPVDVFHLTLRISQDTYHQVRKLFLNKVHQYIKERLVDAKFACAFLLNIAGPQPIEFKENKHNLTEVVQMCHQVRARQLSSSCDMTFSMAYPECILAHLVHALAHHPSCPDANECKDVKEYEPIYRQLNLLLSVLLHEYLEGKTGMISNKESLTAVVSIFKSIKQSQDIVDGLKSSCSHAISDLGLSITKVLVGEKANFSDNIPAYPLPAALYKSYKKEESDLHSEVTVARSWLSDDSVMAYFKSLKLEDKEFGGDAVKDEKPLIDADEDTSEIPLGKIIKHLKTPKAKKKKGGMKKPSAESDQTGQDYDILGMVREINLDHLETNDELDDKVEPHGSRKTVGKKISKKVSETSDRKKHTNSKVDPAPVTKRKINNTDEDALTSSSSPARGSEKASRVGSHNSDIAGHTESDYLASCEPKTRIFSSRHKKRGNLQNLDTLKTLSEEDDDKNAQSTTRSLKKRKRKTVAGLVKCSSGKSGEQNMELVGCRVKVWWPIDKEFYEGVVQSFDPRKRKHVIMYDDGDVEVLQLDKERWEILSSNCSSKESPKSTIPSKRVLPEQKGTKRKKNASRYTNGSAKRNVKPKTSIELEESAVSENRSNHSETESKDGSHLSNTQPDEGSDADNSDYSEESPKKEVQVDGEQAALEESNTKEDTDSSDNAEASDSDDEPLSAWKLRAKR